MNRFQTTSLFAALAFALLAGRADAIVIINEVNIGDSDYVELFNFSASEVVDLAGFELSFADSGSPAFDLTLPSTILQPNSTVVVVAESPAAGDIDAGQNISFFPDRNLSLTLSSPAGGVVDFWAHGGALFGAPATATFSPAPLTGIVEATQNTVSYQRIAVSNSGLDFFARDWSVAATSRGVLNADQVFAVPEPASLGLLALSALALGVRRRRAA